MTIARANHIGPKTSAGDLIAKVKADAALGRMPAGRVAGSTGEVLAGSAPDVDLSIGPLQAVVAACGVTADGHP
jgi:hypothetical protein